MTFAQAAQKAIELGGKYDGHELPEDINAFTKTSAKALAGQGLMAVAKDAYPRDGQSQSYVVGFAEVEVDTETGVVKVIDYTAIGDVGTVLNPRSLKGQLFGGSMLGLGHAQTQRWAYDQQYGVALARRFYQNKPPTILDAPRNFTRRRGRHLPDPETPTGVRGVGEPPVGAAYGAIMNAIADAIGDEIFRQVAGVARHHPEGARERREADARSADGAHLEYDADCGCGLRRSAVRSPQVRTKRELIWP